jgi:hypothetical protein
MIVYVGDWVKVMGAWRQVVSVNPLDDTFKTISAVDGEYMTWGTNVPEVFEKHLSDIGFHAMLDKVGL